MRWAYGSLASFALAIVVTTGCKLGEVAPAPAAQPPPLLAGKARAAVITDPQQLIPGPGAEGRPGDLVIENEFVRFIVAAPDHAYPGALSGGHLLDAAVQGAEDRMRLLLPRLGPDGRGLPVYQRAEIVVPGGEEAAAIRVEGYYSENPSVLVSTVYELRPGARMLRITTAVDNQSASTLVDFALADWVYHGRTSRYAEGLGLHPFGREGKTDWLSFFCDRTVWGLFPEDRSRMESSHPMGRSELIYSATSLPPGVRTRYARCLMVAEGAPSLVSEAMLGGLFGTPSTVRCRVTEKGTGRPVAGAWLELRIGRTVPSSLLITDSSGGASCSLPAGTYTFACRAPGRPPAADVPLTLQEEAELSLTLELAPEARVVARVRELVDGKALPSVARITPYSYPNASPGPCFGTHFYPCGDGPSILVGRSGNAIFPLSPASESAAGVYGLVVSRGPLYCSRVRDVRVAAGQEQEVALSVERVIDPGEYVAVDFRQYSDASPDCALTVAERVLSNECEGVDAAVLCAPYGASLRREEVGDGPALIDALELAHSKWGSFSVLPLRGGYERAWRALPPVHRTEREPRDMFRWLRIYFPEAVIQVNSPLDERRGYFKSTGWDPEAPEEEGTSFCPHFDALELLTGRDVEKARELLPYWFSLLNQGRKVFVTGGSASRALLWEEAGVARTYVHCPSKSRYPDAQQVRDAIAALRDRPNAFVTNGPFLDVSVNDRPIGSLQTARGTVDVHLRVYAPLWVDVRKVSVYRNGSLIRELDVPATADQPLRLDVHVTVEVNSDCWLVAMAEGETGMWPVYCGRGAAAVVPFAVTNPFWLDADGDGVVRVGK